MPEYQYNLAGELTSEAYPSGCVVKTAYDQMGRVNGVTGQMASATTAKSYASQFYEEPENAPSACGGDESVLMPGFPKGRSIPLVKGEVNASPAKPRRATCFSSPSSLLRNYLQYGGVGEERQPIR